ncbi:histone-lysine N-methyltransferase SETMAR [Trichonephila clavata]|uniref:Histone-lysine N-methyltransferase SETMAR n=1 Tax=Trichonephila clavata TaxID=2740835 RepID=A0A8X6L2P2_TRICU|nr:histone-lysine N-methyltransferase SETMAR [Trichonephila clavata]
MYEDRRWTLLELERASGIERRNVHRMLRNELHLHKNLLRWVPHALKEVKRWLRYAIWSEHFACLQEDGDQFLSRIFVMDELWTRPYLPELKCQSAEWRHAGSLLPEICK